MALLCHAWIMRYELLGVSPQTVPGYITRHESERFTSPLAVQSTAGTGNVFDKRVAQTSESRTFCSSTNTIFNCHTTTLGTNDNYIRSS
jgi:hypothetical protein